jgi:hypothetical protein
MKRWVYGVLALICSCLGTLLSVVVFELSSEGDRGMTSQGHQIALFAFMVSLPSIFFVGSVLLLALAIRKPT